MYKNYNDNGNIEYLCATLIYCINHIEGALMWYNKYLQTNQIFLINVANSQKVSIEIGFITIID